MKIVYLYWVFALAVLTRAESAGMNEIKEPRMLRGPRPLRDRFRNVRRSLTKTEVNYELDIFKSYGCEHMVVLSNKASSPFLLWCSSGDEDVKEIYVIPGESFAFTFKPKKNGKSIFQCVLNYETKWATFSVYDEEALHSPPRENSYSYQYSVRNDGVYVNNKHKIRSFFRSFDYSDEYVQDDFVEGNVDSDARQFRDSSTNDSRASNAVLDQYNSIRANLSKRNIFYQAPKAILDNFNIISTNLSKGDLRTEIDDFANYDCERMVLLSNDAASSFRLWCSSADESIREETVSVGRALSFSFKPKHNGNSKFQCIVNYQSKWATFDVFKEKKENGCTCKEQQDNYVYQYSIRHYGVYGEGNKKIKSLFNGRNQYTLWGTYNDYLETPSGKLMTGYVDGPADCRNVPLEVNDKAAAMTVCDGQCVIAYEHINCQGRRQQVQAYSGCRTVKLGSGLYKDLSSVKGC